MPLMQQALCSPSKKYSTGFVQARGFIDTCVLAKLALKSPASLTSGIKRISWDIYTTGGGDKNNIASLCGVDLSYFSFNNFCEIYVGDFRRSKFQGKIIDFELTLPL